jgi:LacI family transcriptional regulator
MHLVAQPGVPFYTDDASFMKPSQSASSKSAMKPAADGPEQTPAGRVTVRQIAQRLGVSHTTVSRALKNDPRISAPVRKRIQTEAETMGYRPDPMLSALSHYRRSRSPQLISSALAWVNCWPEPKKLRSFKEFDLYWQGAQSEAERSGYHLDEFNCPADMTPARLQTVLGSRAIQGMLLTPGWSGAAPDWTGLEWEKFCVVRFGHSLPSPQAHLVTSHQLANGALAFHALREKGYRRIGMVTRRNLAAKIVQFTAGFLHQQLQVPQRERLFPLLLREPDANSDQAALRAWLNRSKPDAILTDLPDVPDLLSRSRVSVPKDIALATTSVLDGRVDAGIYQNSDEIGAAAVQMLISLIHHNQRGIPATPRELLVTGKWIDGKSVPSRLPL